ncbi:enoyl-CoA hydratase/isomerase family protein [Ramlibacter sp. G-1-2-2]|uniref:Enoyl-CoA hydratase/isomerase family protein n=1 Tax=Ramlibacter agri TaxID=2728837 RepID=A0A848GYW2_9BURK|nr:enoyl-CoA hydratase/isomerase family protein [Ramlibacter agri]NML43357.1 enoyl-CoA hydratase/isomerase family protein [Ramlibacter agri]
MIRTHVQDGIAEILLDSPPVNGITEELLAALMTALRQAGDDPQVRAIILGSAVPGRFCGGLDLPKFRRSTPSEMHSIVGKLYHDLHVLQSSLPKPVIAAITGSVRGGGMSISITCDMIVAAEDSNFGYPEMEIGLLPSIHYNHLPRIVGRYRAFDLLFTGRVFDAQEALELGLVSRLAPADQVLEKARELARVFAGKSPELMRLGKAAFVRATDNGYRAGAAAAVDLVSTVFGTADCAEGLAAFAEKRKPKWGAA